MCGDRKQIGGSWVMGGTGKGHGASFEGDGYLRPHDCRWFPPCTYMSKLIRVYILKILTLSYENYTSMKLVQKTHYFKDKMYVELRV